MVKKLIQLYLFWILYFFIFRIFFLLYQDLGGADVPLSGYLLSCYHALRLDWSASSYFIALPFLLLSINIFLPSKIIVNAVRVFHYILIPVATILLLANMPLYQSWGTLINRRALTFIADPVEMLASVTTGMLIISLIAVILLSVMFIKLFHKINFEKEYSTSIGSSLTTFIISGGLIFLGIRGGWQLIPINESTASFSSKALLNDAAVNPLWHLGNNISKSKLSDKNPYAEFDVATANALKNSLFSNQPCPELLLNTKQPNIVFLLLESFTADIIEPLGGEKNATPFLSSLCDSSVLFTNIYASGRRTDQALPSVFGGFPAQPDYSVMRFTEKAAALPSMPAQLLKNGYHLSFYYGGETGFSNMGAYLHNNGFEKIISKDDFPSENHNSKWGAHDEFVLQKQAADLNQEKQPFFSVLLTLTSHEPFEIPRKNYLSLNNEPNKFRNAVRYTDDCLKSYFENVRKQKWFSNTLFILVADHGHRLPLNRDYNDVLSHRIPLLFYGDVIKQKYRGKKFASTGAQHDIPVTLLQQLNLPYDAFQWSAGLTDSCRIPFAYVDLDQRLGWITDQGSLTYLHHSNKPEYTMNVTDTMEYKRAAAYRQVLYSEFLSAGEKKSK